MNITIDLQPSARLSRVWQKSIPVLLLCFVKCILLFIASATHAQNSCAVLPTDVLQNGYAVYTCASASGPVMGIRDIRTAGSRFVSSTGLGVDNSGQFPVVKMYYASDFEGNQVGSIEPDDRNGAIYVATYSMWDCADYKTNPTDQFKAKIYKISPNGATVTLFATLPGTKGIGFIDVDEVHDKIYAVNMDDGLIYSVNISAGPGQTSGYTTFAPHAANAIDGNLPPLGQRLFGVGYNAKDSRLYYSVWSTDLVSTGNPNTIRSIAINNDGSFNTASDKLEITLPTIASLNGNTLSPNTTNSSMPVGDIVFNSTGTIMLAVEKTFNYDAMFGAAHAGRAFEFRGTTGSWVMEALEKHALTPSPYAKGNAAGGASFTYGNTTDFSTTGAQDYVVFSGDYLNQNSYGFQYEPLTGTPGGSSTGAILVNSGGAGKGGFLDIDVRTSAGVCLCAAGTTAPVLSQTALTNTCPATTADLSSITATNTPANTMLAWFSSATATTATQLTAVGALPAGTYYAAFYDNNNNCFSPTTAVTATVNPCVISASGTVDCSKIQITPAPTAGTPRQVVLVVSIAVTATGTLSPVTVSGSGMSLANGITALTASATGTQQFYIPLQYDGSALTNAFTFTVGSAGSCTADLTKTPVKAITDVWTLECLPSVGPALKK